MNEASTAERPIEELVTEAVEGSRSALEEIVLRIQDRIYYLALRMLSHPEDARDASQEILIKVITNLKGFRFEGPFAAWVFRIAANHLNTFRKSRMERFEINWDKACGLVDQAEARGWLSDPPAAPNKVLEIEARLRCTQALLTAMDRPHRLAFILGVVMDVSSLDGAYILEISPAAFRKRISRARSKLKAFLAGNCGLFDASNRCCCPGVLANHLQNRWISQESPVFMQSGFRTQSNEDLAEYLKELDELSRVSTLYKAFPQSQCPTDISHKIKQILDQNTYRVLTDRTFH
jgi:RNA polymerase sigma factor (sigma-70 family)